MLGSELRDEICRERGRVGERLVEDVRERLEEKPRLRPDEQFVMVGAVALRDAPRVGALVEAPLLEADRERVHGFCRLLRGERGQDGGVDAAREQDADGNVGEQVRADGILLADEKLRLLPYTAILSAEANEKDSPYIISKGTVPNRDVQEHLRLLSRFPQGLTPELIQRLLDAYGQTELAGATP